MKKVYICSPYRGDITANIRNAQGYSRIAADMGFAPITPHLYLPLFLNDNDPKERQQGLDIGLELLSLCDEVWVFGEPTEGMKGEIHAAGKHGIPVEYMTQG